MVQKSVENKNKFLTTQPTDSQKQIFQRCNILLNKTSMKLRKYKNQYEGNLLLTSTLPVFISLKYFRTSVVPRFHIVRVWFPFPLMFQAPKQKQAKRNTVHKYTALAWSESLRGELGFSDVHQRFTYRSLCVKIPRRRRHVLRKWGLISFPSSSTSAGATSALCVSSNSCFRWSSLDLKATAIPNIIRKWIKTETKWTNQNSIIYI